MKSSGVLAKQAIKLPCTAKAGEAGPDNNDGLLFSSLGFGALGLGLPMLDASKIDVSSSNEPVKAQTCHVKPPRIFGTPNGLFTGDFNLRVVHPKPNDAIPNVEIY